MSYNTVDIDTYQAVLRRAEQAERALAEAKESLRPWLRHSAGCRTSECTCGLAQAWGRDLP